MKEKSPSFYFKKLNGFAYESMDRATERCTKRGNPELELAHWLDVLCEADGSDVAAICDHFGVDRTKVKEDFTIFLDGLPRGATRVTSLSHMLVDTLEQGWVTCSLGLGEARLRTGHIILAMLQNAGLKTYLGGLSAEFRNINTDTLEEKFKEILADSEESRDMLQATPSGAVDGMPQGESALEKFTVDLTQRAREGKIDNVVCRDDEIRQIIDILMRRRQNNPLLAGEAGVGKTAVVEGFALRLATGDVPPAFKDVVLRTLDLGLLQAGASMKGEFEDRLRKVIEEVQASPQPIITFIDEAHTLIGAGGAEGVGDAANLLKPALARGELRTIAATTWGEYKKHIEKDPALTRRFQVVKIEEPTEEQANLMLRGLLDTLEKHHKIEVRNEALLDSVRLSHRYIPDRQLPDKAVSLLDTACARVALTQNSDPAQVERQREKISHLEIEEAVLKREADRGAENAEHLESVEKKLVEEREHLVELEERWKKERELIDSLLEARATSEDGSNIEQIRKLEADLEELQGETPMIYASADGAAVASVVADWTGIPIGRMVRDEIGGILKIADRLRERVIGQDHALDAIAKRVVTSRAGIDNPAKPKGVFLLVGPSGVGKTETALALAESLYGGESNLITINMSEFQERHTVSTLKGAPPGYVGYGEGGVLTEAVRRRPHSVVLLDEVEKAHSDVHEVFFQVFDKGFMEDGMGTFIDFKNTIILLTSNVGTETMMKMCADPELIPDPDVLVQELRPDLLEAFPAAWLGRLVAVPYLPLAEETLKLIIRLQLDRIKKRVEGQKNIPFSYSDDVLELVLNRCKEAESGARVVDAILTNTLLPSVGRELLEALYRGEEVSAIEIGVKDSDFEYKFQAS